MAVRLAPLKSVLASHMDVDGVSFLRVMKEAAGEANERSIEREGC